MKYLRYLFFAVAIVSACKKSPSNKIERHDVDVYVAATSASYTDLGNIRSLVAGYWKNGVLHNLADTDDLDKRSVTTGIAVKGDDVYVIGFTYKRQNPVAFIATYWKNGQAHALPSDDYNSFAISIFINGTDVYIGGFSNGQTSPSKGIYWKNGEKQEFSPPYTLGRTCWVDGSDLYTTGNDPTGGIWWKNDMLSHLTPGSNAYGLWLDEGNLYVSGTITTADHYVATYWKNGAPVQLQPDTSNSSANFIVVSGSDVYAGGFVFSKTMVVVKGTVWKNGVGSEVPECENIKGMKVDGNDLYISGEPQHPNAPVKAAYWINKKIVPLKGAYYDSGFVNGAFADGIVLVKH